MYGKATTHLIRLSGILHNIDIVSELIIEAPNVKLDEITEDFVNYLNDKVNKEFDFKEFSIIRKKTVQNAETLLRYINSNRVILLNYDFNLNEDCSNLHECASLYIENKIKERETKIKCVYLKTILELEFSV